MSNRYREIMRAIGDNEVKFPAAKRWREERLLALEDDPKAKDGPWYSRQSHWVWSQYYANIEELTAEKNRLEEEMRDEIEHLNTIPVTDRTRGAIRADGKVDFPRSYLLLDARSTETLDLVKKTLEIVQKLCHKIDQMHSVTVD